MDIDCEFIRIDMDIFHGYRLVKVCIPAVPKPKAESELCKPVVATNPMHMKTPVLSVDDVPATLPVPREELPHVEPKESKATQPRDSSSSVSSLDRAYRRDTSGLLGARFRGLLREDPLDVTTSDSEDHGVEVHPPVAPAPVPMPVSAPVPVPELLRPPSKPILIPKPELNPQTEKYIPHSAPQELIRHEHPVRYALMHSLPIPAQEPVLGTGQEPGEGDTTSRKTTPTSQKSSEAYTNLKDFLEEIHGCDFTKESDERRIHIYFRFISRRNKNVRIRTLNAKLSNTIDECLNDLFEHVKYSYILYNDHEVYGNEKIEELGLVSEDVLAVVFP